MFSGVQKRTSPTHLKAKSMTIGRKLVAKDFQTLGREEPLLIFYGQSRRPATHGLKVVAHGHNKQHVQQTYDQKSGHIFAEAEKEGDRRMEN